MRYKGITLVEMLIAMAITLVMMAAVVTVFANISGSIQRRRAAVELATQMRHIRNVLQRDLQGATCPALTWQRTDSNHGYIEIVEGPYSDSHPSMLTDGDPDSDRDGNPDGTVDELNPAVSLVPRYGDTYPGTTRQGDFHDTLVQRDQSGNVVSTLNGLGDFDDTLALTVRSEEEPFIGLVPPSVRPNARTVRAYPEWGSTTIKSPLAEVVWFAVENPQDSAGGFFGEPGLRTIYRRTLLIAPWVAPYRYTDPTTGASMDVYRERGTAIHTHPGVVRVLSSQVNREDIHKALAALVSFQERYDLSVRLEFNPRLGDDGRYVIVANTLADLTKRENRYEHHYYWFNNDTDDSSRIFPFGMVSLGGGYGGNREPVEIVADPELPMPNVAARGQANLARAIIGRTRVIPGQYVRSFRVTTPDGVASRYASRPFAYVEGDTQTGTPATVRAMLNDEGEVIHLIHGLVPLSRNRRGQDVILSDALAFDIRVYDPGAPIFGVPDNPSDVNSSMTVVEPSDAAWLAAYRGDREDDNDLIGDGSSNKVRFLGQGAYGDLGYRLQGFIAQTGIDPAFAPNIAAIPPWFFDARWLPDRLGNALVPGYSVYDTWSFHYENNGVNEDNDFENDESNPPNMLPMVDEGTNGFDDRDPTIAGERNVVDHNDDIAHSGVDDVEERETTPPYDRPLRGMLVKLRALERDSQQIHEVTVSESFVPE